MPKKKTNSKNACIIKLLKFEYLLQIKMKFKLTLFLLLQCNFFDYNKLIGIVDMFSFDHNYLLNGTFFIFMVNNSISILEPTWEDGISSPIL